MRKAHNLGDISYTEQKGKTEITVNISLKQTEDKLNSAQYLLDSQIMTDMVPYMPHLTGTFVNLTRARSQVMAGTGVVVAAAPPYGRYLYEGKVMVDKKSKRGPALIPGVGPRFQKGAKLVATSRPLKYSNPKATPYWFNTAKKNHLKDWLKIAKEAVR